MAKQDHCLGKNQSGEPCSAQPVRPSGYCYWHDPAVADDRHANNRRGGENRSREARARKLLAKGLQDLGDLQTVLMVALIDTLGGKLDPKVANAVANLAGKIKDLEVGVELEAQMAELQRRMVDLSERAG
jgi:hypothetical protein